MTLTVLHTAVSAEGSGDGGRNPAVTTDLLLCLASDAGYHLPTGLYL